PLRRCGPHRIAVIREGEEGTVRRVSYGQLARDVGTFAAGLRASGVGQGDRVVVFMPMTYACVVAVLAVGALGAVFIPVFSGYGADAIAGRLRDCDASVIITADAFYRRAQVVPVKRTADAAADAAPSVKLMVVAERVGAGYAHAPYDITWDEVVAKGRTPIAPVDTSSEEPLMIM